MGVFEAFTAGLVRVTATACAVSLVKLVRSQVTKKEKRRRKEGALFENRARDEPNAGQLCGACNAMGVCQN